MAITLNTPAPKATKAPKTAITKKRTKKHKESFSRCIYKVLKQMHLDTGIGKKAMPVMNDFIKSFTHDACKSVVANQLKQLRMISALSIC